MGWWNVQGTDSKIGDGPLESLEGAVAEVVAQYREEFGRLPRKAEWEALLYAVLGSATSDERVAEEGKVVSVRIDASPLKVP